MTEAPAPHRLFVQFSDDGRHIRRWSAEPFDGATCYTVAEFVPAGEWARVSGVGH